MKRPFAKPATTYTQQVSLLKQSSMTIADTFVAVCVQAALPEPEGDTP
jgi:hypothetical protein